MPEYRYSFTNFGNPVEITISNESFEFNLPEQIIVEFPLENGTIVYEDGYDGGSYSFTGFGKSLHEDHNELTKRFVLSIQRVNNNPKLSVSFFGDVDDVDYTLYSCNVDVPFARAIKIIARGIFLSRMMPSQEKINQLAASRITINDQIDSIFGDINTNASLNTRNIPADSTNAVMMNTIEDGNSMVNFQGEFNRGRYYKKSTYNQLPDPKKNPFTRERITSKTNYRARVPAASGGRRKTRKSYKGRKGTRKGVRK
jgi:hypothetical protein